MKERPILFSAPMVRAILAGTKTVTRRVVAAPTSAKVHGRHPIWAEAFVDPGPSPAGNPGPYLQLPITGGDMTGDRIVDRVYPRWFQGDRLWVRETWRTHEDETTHYDGILFRADNSFQVIENTCEGADRWVDAHDNGKHVDDWRPSIFMKRWMSRITLEVVSVRVERLQEVTEDDAKAEGCVSRTYRDGRGVESARLDFERLWQSINGKRPGCSWADNPWVWRVEFRRIDTSPSTAEGMRGGRRS